MSWRQFYTLDGSSGPVSCCFLSWRQFYTLDGSSGPVSCCFVSWRQFYTLDGSSGPVSCCFQPIPDGHMTLPGNHCCFKDVLESHEWRLSSLNNALSSLIVVIRGLTGLGRS